VIANERRAEQRRRALAERSVAHAVAELQAVEPSPVLEALALLSVGDREVVLLAAWDGLTASEAAAVLECSATAYRIRLHRARRKLAARLEPKPVKSPGKPCPTLQPEELP
jgi:DNA-directed RNA polymerase specialized sigma24 family protein